MKKKILFIDRDGTLIKEPPVTFQVNTLEELSFLPGVITWLRRIATEMEYELVMVTNQDGLGTEKYPQAAFDVIQNKMLEILTGEGIEFKAIHIDVTYPEDKKDTRKPGIGMLRGYLNGDYDIENSFVIGDRLTDIQLAENLGCKAIFIKNYENPAGSSTPAQLIATHWEQIYKYLKAVHRTVTIERNTHETQIQITLNPDGNGQYNINTGLGFFNHMLEQLAKHSGADLTIQVKGDLHIDEHHTIEDTGLALGQAFAEALRNKMGMERYGYCLPMDDCLAQVAIDFGGRNWLVWEAEFKREKVGDMPAEMFFHFFKSFSDAAKCNLNIKAEGENEHHKIESIFKAWARAIKMAVKTDANSTALPTTKGVL
jgi:imidazoleglycerol-phosphate dehydratase / histidinol-phosphatase